MDYRSSIILRMFQVVVIIGFICGGAILPIGPVAGEEPTRSNSPPEEETPSRSDPAPRYMPPQMKPSYRFPDSKPMPPPPANGKINPDIPRGKAVTKNMITGEITESEGVTLSDILGYEMTPGQESVLRDMVMDPEGSAKDFNGWDLVPDPTAFEYPRRVRIWMTFTDLQNNTDTFACSGTLIDAMHVVTAGHCLYSHDNPDENWYCYDWADSVTVAPGYQDDVAPWGTSDSVNLHAWTGWTQEEDHDFDVAIIDLDRPIGFATGWHGIGFHPDCDYFTSPLWVHCGYPEWADPSCELMYTTSGDFDSCEWPIGEGNTVAFNSPSGGGTSGSGAVKDNVVWAVHSTGTETYSTDCAISSGMFSDIENWLEADRPSNADLMPLNVVAEADSGFAGNPLQSFSFVLGNYSKQAYTGGVNCYIYLSTDDVITTNDVQLAYHNVQVDLPALGGWNIGLPPPTIPLATAPDDYFLGLIINLADANESNNTTGVFDVDPIKINCPEVPTTTITQPPDDVFCMPTSLTIDWVDVPDVVDYELRIGNNPNSGTIVHTGTSSQYTATGLDYGKTYYLKVWCHSYCGGVSDGSQTIRFTTEILPSSNITFTSPPEGEMCQDIRMATVRWDAMPGADLYQVQLGKTCATGTVYNVNPPLTEHSFYGLQNSTTYYYRVKVLDECGNWSDWSLCGDFTTDPDFVAVPHSLYPSDGYPCMSPNVWLSWWPMEDAGGYEVQWGDSCESGVIDVTSTNQMNLPVLTGGTYFWRVRTVHMCGQISDWSLCQSFTVDAVAPTWPDGLLSSTHTLASWSHNMLVTTKWIDAVDEGCNVEYRLLWDNLPATVPDELVLHINETEYTSDPLANGDNHWFHVVAKDMPGNLAINPQHLGPFWIDALPPVNPTVTTLTPEYVWVEADSLRMHWSGASDAHSGLAGYTVLFDQIDVATPLATPVINEERAAWLPDNHGVWWFHLTTTDLAGNWSLPVHKGPYLMDMMPPDVLLQYPVGSEVFVQSTVETIAWLADDHSQSGVASVGLNYSTDGGTSWYHITTLTDQADLALGTFDWQVPYANSDSVVVRVTATDAVGNSASNQNERFIILQAVSGVESPDTPALPSKVVLEGNVPNPFNPMTVIRYGVPLSTKVNLCIYTLEGHRIRTLVNTVQSGPAWYETTWNGQDNAGQVMAAGVYFFRLEAGDYVETKRMTLLK